MDEEKIPSCSNLALFSIGPGCQEFVKKPPKTIVVCIWCRIIMLNYAHPSSIYSCSIEHILEHELCHLGCWAVSEKFLKPRNFCLGKQLFGVVFSCFGGQKLNLLSVLLLCSVRTKKFRIKFFLKIWKKNCEKIILGQK